MIELESALTIIDTLNNVSNNPLVELILDRMSGYKITQWKTEREVIRKWILDEYEKAKKNGISGVPFIAHLRSATNLISTAVKSAKYIDPNKPNDIQMDNDFFWNTLEHAKTISNEHVQKLIAKIIAGEYNEPGSYSMSTLHTLKMLGKEELALFERVCSLIVRRDNIPCDVFVIGKMQDIKEELKIDFTSFQHLQQLGLVLPNKITEAMENPSKKYFVLPYFNRLILFEPTHERDFSMSVPRYYRLSITGKQIHQHLNPQPNQKYLDWLQKNYTIANYELVKDIDTNKLFDTDK